MANWLSIIGRAEHCARECRGKAREEEAVGLLKGYTLNDSTSFLWVPPPKGSTTSPPHEAIGRMELRPQKTLKTQVITQDQR